MDKVKKIPMYVLWGIALISVVLILLFAVKLDGPDSEQMISTNLMWAYSLFGFAGFLAVLFAVIQLFSDLKAAKSALMYLGIIGVLVLIAYIGSSNEIPVFHGSQKLVDDGTMTVSVVRWVDTGLHITYYLVAIALLAISGFGVSKLIKR